VVGQCHDIAVDGAAESFIPHRVVPNSAASRGFRSHDWSSGLRSWRGTAPFAVCQFGRPIVSLCETIGTRAGLAAGSVSETPVETGEHMPVGRNKRRTTIRDIARRFFGDDDLEIDANARLSESEDGVWVQAWVFVYAEDVGEADIAEQIRLTTASRARS
jgi:hypothetical protein